MMMTHVAKSVLRTGWHRWLAALLLCGLPGVLLAQNAAPSTGDPPARVARLSYVSGDLGLLPAGAKDWSDAQVNRPLTRGDRLSSGHDARAELQLGDASLRMAANTHVGFLELDEQLAQIELTQGTLNISVRAVADGQSYEIDTPTIALVLDRPGVYRVDVAADGQTTSVTAFQGDATAYGENNAQQLLHAGNHYTFADSALADVNITNIRGQDAFDYWCANRDSEYANSVSRQYVSNDVVGAADLDQYGQWQNNPEYGQIWYPNDVGADWAPYQDGQWAWIEPWGWTWIDAAPWGYAPFHYGRWAYAGNRWGWIPGPRGVRSVFAPALVAFIGGSGWNLSIGVGAPIGWFPLGPRDIYHPWYRSSRGYYTRVNRSDMRGRGHHHKRDLHDRLEREYGVYQKPRKLRHIYYMNRHAPHANTVVSASAFASGKPIRAARLHERHVDAERLRKAPVTNAADVKPGRRTRTRRDRAARALPVASFRRTVISRHKPSHRADRLVPVDQPIHSVRSFGSRPPHIRLQNHADAKQASSPSHAADATANARAKARGSSSHAAPTGKANPRVLPASKTRLDRGAQQLPSVSKLRAADDALRSSRFAHRNRRSGSIDRARTPDGAISRKADAVARPGIKSARPGSDQAKAKRHASSDDQLPDVKRLRPTPHARFTPAPAIKRNADSASTSAATRSARAARANPLTHRPQRATRHEPQLLRERAPQIRHKPAPMRQQALQPRSEPARRFNPPPRPAARTRGERTQPRSVKSRPRPPLATPHIAPAKSSKPATRTTGKSDKSDKRRRLRDPKK